MNLLQTLLHMLFSFEYVLYVSDYTVRVVRVRKVEGYWLDDVGYRINPGGTTASSDSIRWKPLTLKVASFYPQQRNHD